MAVTLGDKWNDKKPNISNVLARAFNQFSFEQFPVIVKRVSTIIRSTFIFRPKMRCLFIMHVPFNASSNGLKVFSENPLTKY